MPQWETQDPEGNDGAGPEEPATVGELRAAGRGYQRAMPTGREQHGEREKNERQERQPMRLGVTWKNLRTPCVQQPCADEDQQRDDARVDPPQPGTHWSVASLNAHSIPRAPSRPYRSCRGNCWTDPATRARPSLACDGTPAPARRRRSRCGHIDQGTMVSPDATSTSPSFTPSSRVSVLPGMASEGRQGRSTRRATVR